MPTHAAFGNRVPLTEPYWYQGYPSAYYTAEHVAFRHRVRAFVEEELKPNMETRIKEGGYPMELHQLAYERGIQGVLYPPEYGGTRPPHFDAFFELILWDEMARVGGGAVLGQMNINSMALPPILEAGSEGMKQRVVRSVICGEKNICLAISEPSAGSDVAQIETRAIRKGNVYIVNGMKKWITGGWTADFFTVAVKTTNKDNKDEMTLLLIERTCPGIHIRKMETQFDTCHSTTFIEFDDVKVPVENRIGEEGQGFKLLMLNFNHERLVIAIGACRHARLCYEHGIQYALERKTFGKMLIDHQIIRFKLAEMARQIETLFDHIERIVYQFSQGIPNARLGPQCALLKVNASKVFEYCAREASQILGGNSLVKEGKGKPVERLYREVRMSAIPGGSEEVLLDFAIRDIVKTSLEYRKR